MSLTDEFTPATTRTPAPVRGLAFDADLAPIPDFDLGAALLGVYDRVFEATGMISPVTAVATTASGSTYTVTLASWSTTVESTNPAFAHLSTSPRGGLHVRGGSLVVNILNSDRALTTSRLRTLTVTPAFA